MSKRTSVIWKLDPEDFSELVSTSKGYSDALAKIGLKNKGGNFRTFRKRMEEENIDYSHFYKLGSGIKMYHPSRKLEECLTENSTYSRSSLKIRLLNSNILQNICGKCGLLPEWNGEKLSLQLDHINGISNDNRLYNLRLLCPNCHSQTSNFAGRAIRKNPIKYCKCGKVIANTNEQCKKCNGKSSRGIGRPNTRKVVRPSKEELEKMIWEKSSLQIGREFGVSDGAIRKWRKFYGITSFPGKGYWGFTGNNIKYVKYNFTKYQVEEMYSLYKTTLNFKKTASHFNLAVKTLKNWFKKFNLL